MNNSTPAFSQVAFRDVPHSYPPATSVSCSYTLAEHFHPSPRDWVGIFKVGWSTTKDYHTFVWVESSGESSQEQSLTSHAYFKDYYLPKDELDFYQFCYVDSSGQVRGASTPFCFKVPDNGDKQSAENSSDNDLLVITTQEQVEQSDREKVALQNEVRHILQRNEELEKTLREERREVGILKDKQDELVSELCRTKEQNECLLCTLQEQREEVQRLKEEMLIHMTNQVELQEQNLAESTQPDPNPDDDCGLLLEAERQLREANVVIAEKDAIIEENNNLTSLLKRHNQELAQENQKLSRDIEERQRTLDDLQMLLPTHSVHLDATPTPPRTIQPDAPETCESFDENIPVVTIVEDEDEEDQPALMCRHCLESFPGSTRAEVECHERNHQVCPFCTLICDDMEQAVFEDHVYSHEM
ncbi:calcium-binding and coiled-coil domain-containing protein 2 isoform X1 [Phycodurus eques]|uniref:calcium-binding and coiled-coil domain-containing protein 2 isoform X1 n=2 Tax=Phycodurus eques TaxID=693459 RepID=UPI002ACD4379|nr:calcium-binding and coiled-coil domain-containing protein 2 isoform X1 [Phycodurus eques]XP_061562446.1 calcium-binding and coiled-coil domain-containing protein 2 isoform X1 [Phycodurus eques]